jgi:hypothetical protein
MLSPRIAGSLFALALAFALTACDDDPDPVEQPDASLADAAADAIPSWDAPMADGPPAVACDPLAQSGCADGEKCSWYRSTPTSGYTTCVANGSVALDGACTAPDVGSDDCLSGGICIGGQCQAICSSVPESCAADATCVLYGEVFDLAYGGCEYLCNPVTQRRNVDDAPACGSPDPEAPLRGCYGFSFPFSCRPAGDPSKTYRVPAAERDGTIFINGCAPGFSPLLTTDSADADVLCIAFCSPDSIYQGHTDGANGLAPHTCAAAGGPGWTDALPDGAPDGVPEGEAAECRHFWLLDSTFSEVGDDIGFCIDFALYSFPSCGTLTEEQAHEAGCTPHGL